MKYEDALKSVRARWKTAVRFILQLTPGQERKSLTGFTTFTVKCTPLPKFVQREVVAGDKLVSPYGYVLHVQSYKDDICECRYRSPSVYAYVSKEVFTDSIWYSDRLPDALDYLPPLEPYTAHVTANGHRLEGKRPEYIGAPGETVVEKAERLFKEANDVYGELLDKPIRHHKIPELGYYEPRIIHFDIPGEAKKQEIVKWMEGRIKDIETMKDETTDTIRKMTYGSKAKGYKECLSYIRTHL